MISRNISFFTFPLNPRFLQNKLSNTVFFTELNQFQFLLWIFFFRNKKKTIAVTSDQRMKISIHCIQGGEQKNANTVLKSTSINAMHYSGIWEWFHPQEHTTAYEWNFLFSSIIGLK